MTVGEYHILYENLDNVINVWGSLVCISKYEQT